MIYIEPSEEQKVAFIQKLRATYNKCLKDSSKKEDEFEKCKACKDHFKSYLKPLNEDISEGYRLRSDVIKYISDYCGVNEWMATEFLLSIGDDDDLINELCKWMSPCLLSDKTKGYPTIKEKREFMYKTKQGTSSFDNCLDCKRKFKKRLEQVAPKPFIINENVKQETKTFTNVQYDWIWGKENKKQFIQRVCNIMGSCKSD